MNTRRTSDVQMPGAFDGETVSRRRFMTKTVHAAGAVAAAAMTLPVLGFAIGPVFDREPDTWQNIGPLSNFPKYTYQPVTMTIVPGVGEAGYSLAYVRKHVESIDGPVKDQYDHIVAISSRCAHVGCPVRFVAAASAFVCPCHGGVYDFRGIRTGGPPPRPLDRFYTLIRDDNVLIGPRYSVNNELRRFAPRDPGQPLDGIGQFLYPGRFSEPPAAGRQVLTTGVRLSVQMQRMSAQDAAFLHIEQDTAPMHVGGISIFEGPPPLFDELLAMIAGKLVLVPRYRQVVRFVPFGVSRPVWVDDPHFNLGYHVRRTALPAPGGDGELRSLVGRVMSQNLDRAKPLWEIWVVEGLEQGRWAMLSKVHHCMVDGVAGTDLMAVLLDVEREPAAPPEDDWLPAPSPSDASLLAQAVIDRALNPFAAAERFAGALRAPRQFAGLLEQTVQGVAHSAGLARQPPSSSLNGPLGPHRRWDWARGRLSDVQRVRKALGGTVNDVVLAAITNGFRELLLSRGESTDRVLRTLVPVSVRRPGERGTYNNRVSAMFAELPVAIEDPVERLRSITEQMAGLKDSKQAVAGEVLTSLSGFAPPMLLALGARVAARIPQRSLNTGTTNVPGPQFPLYAGGRRMLESFPYIPLFAHVRVAVAIFSYDGGLTFGISGDYDTAPDVDVLAVGIEAGLAQLVALAEPAPGSVVTPAPAPEPETA